jgi:hypothetical protein
MPSSILNSDDGVISGTSGLKSSGGDDGALAVQSNGTEVAKFKTTELVINDGGANYDFRVEGDTDANLLVVDASTDRVGIGTSSPTTLLDLYSASGVHLRLANSTTGTATGDGSRIYASGNDLLLVNRESATMQFYTADTERARITAGGYFKASNNGTYDSPTSTSHEAYQSQNNDALVVSATNASLSAPSVLAVVCARNTTNNTFYPIGYYNIGATAYKFRVADSGNVTNTNNSYGSISDVKLKQDIVDAGSQWDDIKNLRIRKYRWKSEPEGFMQLGLVAQEAELVSPGLVEEHQDRDEENNFTGETTKAVKYSVLYMKAVKALQEAMERIETLEAKVAALEAVPGNE